MWSLFTGTDALRRKVRQMDAALRTSFSGVRRDTANLGQWVQYLQQKAGQQQAQLRQMAEEITGLNEELAAIPRKPEDIRRIVDQYYSYEALLARIKHVERRVEELASGGMRQHVPQRAQMPSQPAPISAQTQVPLQELELIKQKLASLEQKKQSLKEKLIKRITKNSKQYVKGIILSYIRKYENVAALQLKEMVVDDQQLCSKSSFYRLMEELEQLEDIGVVREGKEKRYFMKAVKRQ